MDEEIKRVTRSQKKAEVIYVSDDYVNKIVKQFGSTKSPGGKKKSENTPLRPIRELRTLTSQTRSGRKVTKKVAAISLVSEDSDSSEEEIEPTEAPEKPTALFEDGDISGREIFGFHTPKRRNAMVNKATEATTLVMTPKSSAPPPKQDLKTPHHFRNQLKKKIMKEVNRLTEDMLEDSGSEYSPSEDESELSDSSSDSDIKPLDQVKTPSRKSALPPVTPQRKRRGNLSNYVFTSDVYFETHASSKVLTSNHTLSKLKTPKLDQDQLANILKTVNPTHQQHMKALNDENKLMFKRWLFTLREGYSILVYGLGSKRNLLNNFHREYLKNSLVLVVNGYFPGLTLKEILDGIAEDLLCLRTIPTHTHEVVEAISEVLKSSSANRIFLIIHNLDGLMLNNEKSQTVLSQLARIEKLHLIASVDHINCPLLWDQNKLSGFNFIWEDGTSFLPYKDETSYESSAMVQRSGSLALASLKNVFQSLTTNSRNIFKLLLQYQLDNSNKNLGMQFSELYRACRSAFIVSSDLALRTQLTEFIDHQLIKWKKDTDVLNIPIANSVLLQFQNEINEVEE